jgi:hypothetical protein
MSSPPSPSTPRHRRRQKSLSSIGGADPFAVVCPMTPKMTATDSTMDVCPCPLTPQAAMLQHGAQPVSPLPDGSPHPLLASPRSPCNFTPEQQLQIDAMREQVRALEIVYQEAVEKNWPTDDLDKATEDKRQELQALMMKFRTENAPFGLLHSRRLSEPVFMQGPKQR